MRIYFPDDHTKQQMLEALLLVYRSTPLAVDIAMEIQDAIESATEENITEILND